MTDNGKVFTGRFGAKDTEVLFDRICRENGLHQQPVAVSPTASEAAFTMDVTDTRMHDLRWAEFNRRFNALVAGFGGRPLLNQTKHLIKEIVEQTLGKDWKRFLEIRQHEDPEGRFLSDYFAELM